jgi:hypothetical protein
MSLEELVSRDIDEWLGRADYLLSCLKNPDDLPDWERRVRGADREDKGFARLLSRGELIKPLWVLATTIRKCLAEYDLAAAYEGYRYGARFDFLLFKALTLPDARRGEKIAVSAKKGHEAVHGSAAAKRAEYQKIYDALLTEMAKGTPKAAAVVAERFGIAERTVYRAQKKISKID